MLTAATKDIDIITDNLHKFKNPKFASKENIELIYSMNNVEPIVLYYAFYYDKKNKGLNWEFETIREYIGKYSKDNSEKIVSIVGLMSSDKVYTNMFALSGLIQLLFNKEVTMGVVEPATAYEISWALIISNAIHNANNFPFKGDSLKFIQSSLKWESWEMPPLFLSFPIVIDMFETKQVKLFKSIFKYTSPLHLDNIADILSNTNIGDILNQHPFVFNYLVSNQNDARVLLNKKKKTLQEFDILLSSDI